MLIGHGRQVRGLFFFLRLNLLLLLHGRLREQAWGWEREREREHLLIVELLLDLAVLPEQCP
jgi:hypothetical protein